MKTTIITTPGHYDGEVGLELFLIKSSGFIEIDAVTGKKVYRLYPETTKNPTNITIFNYHLSEDWIDLRYYSNIQSINDLTFTSNPFTILLNTKCMIILYLSTSETDMDTIRNLQVFFAPEETTESEEESLAMIVVHGILMDPAILLLIGMIGACVLFTCFHHHCFERKPPTRRKEDAEEMEMFRDEERSRHDPATVHQGEVAVNGDINSRREDDHLSSSFASSDHSSSLQWSSMSSNHDQEETTINTTRNDRDIENNIPGLASIRSNLPSRSIDSEDWHSLMEEDSETLSV